MIRQFAGKTRDLAYIIGVYLGDGWMGYTESNSSWSFRLNTIDMDFAKKTQLAIHNLTGNMSKVHTHSVSKSSKPNNSLTIGAKDLFWIKEECDGKSKFPEFVKELSREDKLALLAGLLDSEGYVATSTTHPGYITIGLKATNEWMNELYQLCKDLGIKIGKIGKEILPSGKVSMRFHFNAQSFVDNGCYFNIARKQNRIQAWLSNPQRLHVEHRHVGVKI